MSKEEFIALAAKVAEGKASLAELAQYNAGYDSFQSKQTATALPSNIAELEEKSLRDLRESFGIQTREVRLWPRIAVAAAAVATIVFGVWFFNYRYTSVSDSVQDPAVAMNDIAPGKNTATLKLANGKTIQLDTNRTSVVVADSVKAMTMLTAATPRGGTYQVVLPDGTKVWLNANSNISFPSQFNGKERKILLEGEAYFEVEKDRTRPFIVSTEKQNVTVLGTHFNVSAYKDESSTLTTLLEGSVSVSTLREGTNKQSQLLKPNQQAINTDDSIQVKEVDTEEYISWKNGDFVFNGAPLRDIMRKLSRWYNVDIVYEGDVANEQYTAKISRNKNISEVIQLLEQAEGVHFKIEGRKVIVTP